MGTSGDGYGEHRRRRLAVLAFVFVVTAAGCTSPFVSADGTGELTVTVRNAETDAPVFEWTTVAVG